MTVDEVVEIIRQYKKAIGKNRKPLKLYAEEDRWEIRAEERGEMIACDAILQRIFEAS